MNEAPSNQTGQGLNDTFSSQPAPQTNPFTADLKGEFTSNFGTNTNAVSQIFKEGGFVNQNKTKTFIIAGVTFLVVVIGAMMLFGEDDFEDEGFPTDAEFAEETEAVEEEAVAEDGEATEEAVAEESEEGSGEIADESGEYADVDQMAAAQSESAGTYADSSSYAPSYSAPSMSSGPISLVEPADGSSIIYDETQGPAVFSWNGGGGRIVFSRNPSMSPVTLSVRVSGSSYSFHHPWPGTWYWKVENASGETEVRSFLVSPPARRNVAVSEPQNGGAVAGSGGVVSWQGDQSVAFYRVELSAGGWANPAYRFATSGNSVQLSGVAPGTYQMRVGAFSEVSGRWEFTEAQSVTVQ